MKPDHLNSALEEFRKSKDAGAFRVLYDLLSGKLYYLCLRYLKNENDAQDILQETFVVAYRKFDSYTGNGNFEGWIRRIAVNHCLQKLRLDQTHFSADVESIALVDENEATEAQEALEEQLLKAMNELPVGYRTILNLAVIEDYSHKEIGQLLNISESTSRSQLTRAKLALREKLGRP